jgi:putative acetyltransferase
MHDTLILRPIRSEDDAAIATIIRTVMPEFGATGSGFAISDPEVDWMSRAYAAPRHAYFVVERDGHILGGAGIAPLTGGNSDTCELRKMYFLPEARGLGAGSTMMARCLDTARQFDFKHCYLETLTGMEAAMQLYQRTGFQRIEHALGETGHGGCDLFFSLDL